MDLQGVPEIHQEGLSGKAGHQREVARIINQHSDELEAVKIFEGEL